MTSDITKERLIRLLHATPAQLAAVDSVLARPTTEAAESGKLKAEMDAGCQMPEPLITKQRLAEIVGVHTRTVEDWMRRGVVSYLKVGGAVRFRWSEVDRELDAKCWVRRRAKARRNAERGARSAEPTGQVEAAAAIRKSGTQEQNSAISLLGAFNQGGERREERIKT